MEESEKFLNLIHRKNEAQKRHYSNLESDNFRSVVILFLYYFLHSAYQIPRKLV